ncbi:MAG: sarcosine oxidase subunit delta [Gaiellaceae bacterium MAG52_C11]|nr:sarcosine oxidase subunit delta [Candidatus Gaiellasilicea maunaloa]
MSFRLSCPSCGPRDVNEFAYGGELAARPQERPDVRELGSYLYFRANVAGVQREWWFHRLGCELWFQAERDTRTNEVLRTDACVSETQAPLADGPVEPADAAIPPEPAV